MSDDGRIIDTIAGVAKRWDIGGAHVRRFAECLLDAFCHNRIAVTTLPPREKWGWADGSVAINRGANDTPIQLEINPGDVCYASLDYARELAAGLLAAIAEVECRR